MSKKNLIKSFIVNFMFLLLVLLFCDMKYEVSDDYMVDAVLSGAFGGGYDAHLLFSNILYGYFLKGLYNITTSFSWYFICQILWCFLSLWAITYVILQKNDGRIGMAIACILAAFVSDDLYILVQFTKTASVLVLAGGVLLLYGLWEKPRKKLSLIFGGLLFLLGSMIRFKCMWIGLGFLFVAFCRTWIQKKELPEIKKCVLQNFFICCALVGIAMGLQAVNTWIWNQSAAYKNYLDTNAMRAEVTDVQSHEYASVAESAAELGLDETDYNMIDWWNFLDREIYDDDTMHAYAGIKKDAHKEYMSSAYNLLKAVWHRKYFTYTIVMGIVVLLILLAVLQNGKKLVCLVPDAVLTVGMLLYLILAGHAMYRVEYSIFLCLAVNITLQFDTRDLEITAGRTKGILITAAVLMLCKLPLYIPDTSYKKMTDEEYSQYVTDVMFRSYDFNVKKYRCDLSRRRPQENLIAQMEADDGHYYLLDFSSTIQRIYLNYKPWERISKGYWQKYYSYLGGVTFGYPTNDSCWEAQGIDVENPYKTLIHDNLYVVDNRQYETKLAYLQKYYYPDVKQELVATIDGFKIWKYSVGE